MKQFKFHCPNCGQRFAAKFDKAGTASKCTTCNQDIMVPMAPSWLKLGFAKNVIPALLSETPALLIRAAHSTEGLNALKSAWNEFAQDECDPSEYTEPNELEVTSIADEGSLIITFTFPKAYRESEAYYAVAILTPPAGTKLTNDTLRTASKRYFLLSLYSGKTNFEEAVGGQIKSHGKGTPPDDRDAFISWARKQCGLSGESPAPTGTETVTADEMQIAAAFAEARSTLNGALQRFLNGKYETFSVKIPITEGDKKEHLWLGDLKYYTDGTFAGIIEDRPKIVESVVQGQACEVAYDDVTDWQSFHQGKIHGNYSLRALIPELSSEEAAKYNAILADLPDHSRPTGQAVSTEVETEIEAETKDDAEVVTPELVPEEATEAPEEDFATPTLVPEDPVSETAPEAAAVPEPALEPAAQMVSESAPEQPSRPKLIIPPPEPKPADQPPPQELTGLQTENAAIPTLMPEIPTTAPESEIAPIPELTPMPESTPKRPAGPKLIIPPPEPKPADQSS